MGKKKGRKGGDGGGPKPPADVSQQAAAPAPTQTDFPSLGAAAPAQPQRGEFSGRGRRVGGGGSSKPPADVTQQAAPTPSPTDFPSLGGTPAQPQRGGFSGRGRRQPEQYGDSRPGISAETSEFPSLGAVGGAQPQRGSYAGSERESGSRGDGRRPSQSVAGRGKKQDYPQTAVVGPGGDLSGPQVSFPPPGGDRRDAKSLSPEESITDVAQVSSRGRGKGGVGRGKGRPGQRDPEPGVSHIAEKMQQVQISKVPEDEKSLQRSPPSHIKQERSLPPPPAEGHAVKPVQAQPPQVMPPVATGGGNGRGSGFIIPQRKKKGPTVGTKGKPITVEVNHLLLQFNKQNVKAVHYDVDFKPEAPKRLFRAAVEAFRQNRYPTRYAAFDGRKNLYSCGRLPINDEAREEITVNDEENSGKNVTFQVTIKFANEVNMSQLMSYGQNVNSQLPQEAIQALDIVLRNPAARSFVTVGRSFFTPPTGHVIDLGDGLHLWYGFYQSAVLGWKPFLNVDVAHKGFPAPKHLMDIVIDINRGDKSVLEKPLTRYSMDDLGKYMNGLKIEYEMPRQPHTKRTFKFVRVKDACDKQRFRLSSGKEMTVGEYFAKEKGYPLRFPHMPCIHVGNDKKEIYLPIELCRIQAGQVLNKKLNENQTAEMVKNAARPPQERKQRILDAVRKVDYGADACIREFGIRVDEQFTKVAARILEPPRLQYTGQSSAMPKAGVWRSQKFYKTGDHLRCEWIIFNLDGRTRDESLQSFASSMEKMGRECGIEIGQPTDIKHLAGGKASPQQMKNQIISYFEDLKKNKKVKLVVVVIPGNIDLYGTVKQAAELSVGILTQCVKAKTMYKMNPSIVGNILLKVNSKLNGVNHIIFRSILPSIMRTPVMIVGADVTHPSPDQTDIPSVAAVAASHDPDAFSYNMLWRLQPPRCEIIEDLQAIMREQLIFFYKKTSQKPLKILFYRDGVSEGQFSQVLNMELNAIRAACKSLEQTYQPKVTFLVVQKRHHTRFFPTRREDEEGKNRNVPAGTIVDTLITHPWEMDFYLVSHASLQGTSRPTKYHKLWDDNDIDEDELEELTYYLCHMFSRCTRSVSYPAPTYYAHLAAFRARAYLSGSRVNLDNLPFEQQSRKIKSDFTVQTPMFFV